MTLKGKQQALFQYDWNARFLINYDRRIAQTVYMFVDIKGVSSGEGGKSPPPKPKKIVVEKWWYFRMLYF